ncbi:hypothetical protein AB0M34_32725 [Nocardia sp. NPDC050193]
MPGDHGVHAGRRRSRWCCASPWQHDLTPDVVGGQPYQIVLAPDVPVHGGRRGVEAFAEAAHVESVQLLFVEEFDGGADDLFPRQVVTPLSEVGLGLDLARSNFCLMDFDARAGWERGEGADQPVGGAENRTGVLWPAPPNRMVGTTVRGAADS